MCNDSKHHFIGLTPAPIPFSWLGGYGVYYDTVSDLHLTLHRSFSAEQRRFISADPMGIDGFVNLYAYGNLNPLFFVDPKGLYNQAVDYWADMAVNTDNGFVRAGAMTMGAIAGTVPDVITLDGRVAGALLGGGEFGGGAIINLNDWSVSIYDTKGLGAGKQSASPSLTTGLGWNTEMSAPNNSDFNGVFQEVSASWTRPGSPVGETASVYFDNNGWKGINYGISTKTKSVGFMYSAVEYDVWDGSDRGQSSYSQPSNVGPLK